MAFRVGYDFGANQYDLAKAFFAPKLTKTTSDPRFQPVDPDFGQMLTKSLNTHTAFQSWKDRPFDGRAYFVNFFVGWLLSSIHSKTEERFEIDNLFWYFDENETKLKIFVTTTVDDVQKLAFKCISINDRKKHVWSERDLTESLTYQYEDLTKFKVERHDYNIEIENVGENSDSAKIPYFFITSSAERFKVANILVKRYKAGRFDAPENDRFHLMQEMEFVGTKFSPDELLNTVGNSASRPDVEKAVVTFINGVSQIFKETSVNYNQEFITSTAEAQCGYLHGFLLNFQIRYNVIPSVKNTEEMFQLILTRQLKSSWGKIMAEYPVAIQIPISLMASESATKDHSYKSFSSTPIDVNTMSTHSQVVQVDLLSNEPMRSSKGKTVSFSNNIVDDLIKQAVLLNKKVVDKDEILNSIRKIFLKAIEADAPASRIDQKINYLSRYLFGSLASNFITTIEGAYMFKVTALKNFPQYHTGFLIEIPKCELDLVINLFESDHIDTESWSRVSNMDKLHRMPRRKGVSHIVVCDVFVDFNDLAFVREQKYEYRELTRVRLALSLEKVLAGEQETNIDKFIIKKLENIPLWKMLYAKTTAEIGNDVPTEDIKFDLNVYSSYIRHIQDMFAFTNGLFSRVYTKSFFDLESSSIQIALKDVSDKKWIVMNFVVGSKENIDSNMKRTWYKTHWPAIKDSVAETYLFTVTATKNAVGLADDGSFEFETKDLEYITPCSMRQKRGTKICDELFETSPAIDEKDNAHNYGSKTAIDLYLEHVEMASAGVMYGIMAKSFLSDIFNGNIKGIFMNVAFLTTATVASKYAYKLSDASNSLKSSVGKGIVKVGSSFLRRSASFAFIGYDLYNNVKQYHDNGNYNSLVNIGADSGYLALDLAETGIEIAEYSGMIREVSSVTQPFSLAVGAALVLGSDIYNSYEKVDKINKMIRLTRVERFTEGVRAFFGLNLEKHIENIISEIDANRKIAYEVQKFFTKHTEIKRYISPIAIRNKTYMSKEEINSWFWSSWHKFLRFFHIHSDEISSVMSLNNSKLIDLTMEKRSFVVKRPFTSTIIEVFCLPPEHSDTSTITHTDDLKYYTGLPCMNSVGYENSNSVSGNATYFKLSMGDDVVRGFIGSSNIFEVGSGHKVIVGGNDNDTFIFSNNSLLNGIFDGKDGVDLIDASNLSNELIYIDATNLSSNSLELNVVHKNFEEFIGRKSMSDIVHGWCNIKHIETLGGKPNKVDEIIFNISTSCGSGVIVIVIDGYTQINNSAVSGIFNYYIREKLDGNVNITLSNNISSFHNVMFANKFSDFELINVTETYSAVYSIFLHLKHVTIIITAHSFQNVNIYFEDGVKLITENGHGIAKLNTEDPIENIVADNYEIISKSTISLVVYSDTSKESVTLSRGKLTHKETFGINIVHNNPDHHSHLFSSLHENIFVIESSTGVGLENLWIKVTVYLYEYENAKTLIDLRKLSHEIEEYDSEFSLVVNPYIPNGSRHEIVLRLQVRKKSGYIINIGSIRIVGINDTFTNSRIAVVDKFVMRLLINLNATNDHGKVSLERYDINLISENIIMLTPNDIFVDGARIEIGKTTIKNYDYFKANESSLIMTNALHDLPDNYENVFYLIIQSFFDYERMKSLTLAFVNKDVEIKTDYQKIINAADVTYFLKRIKEKRYYWPKIS
jgi:hypothetical protein